MPEYTYRPGPSVSTEIIIIEGPHRVDEIPLPIGVSVEETEPVWRVSFPTNCSVPECTYHVHLLGPPGKPVPVPEPSVNLAIVIIISIFLMIKLLLWLVSKALPLLEANYPKAWLVELLRGFRSFSRH